MYDDFVAPALKSVNKVSDDTVVFDLKVPSSSLISALTVQSFSIWPAEYAAAMEKAGTPEQLDLAPLGTGPFQLVEYQKDSLVRFRKNSDFWGEKGGMPDRAAKVDQLIYAITPDPGVRFAKLRENECQVLRYPEPGRSAGDAHHARRRRAGGADRRLEHAAVARRQEAVRRSARARGARHLGQRAGDPRGGVPRERLTLRLARALGALGA